MLGERLRELRSARGLTLRRLADETGLSAGLLSQLENGRTDPSIETLRRLAKVFDSDLADLFREPDAPEVHLSRPGERLRMQAPTGLLTYERLTSGRGNFEMLRGVLAPGDTSAAEPRGHASSECVYVIEGEIVASIGGIDHPVVGGEAITFDSRLPHLFRNDGDIDAVILLAVTPPAP
ncbi:helix-turn-helix domain-containing protein [Pseudactinotalea suaedae]|jgi:transcriptional regulator with XRE-family HTH domain|uniref:helix-turn-helix domain-containing protein n=1 Tax=Pseudactinotalea suaedae TaxID=1524924 RepID=UPI0012E14F34|nr:helix-turn-helix domain-containing protein [Pseudactinotalea suaedae]